VSLPAFKQRSATPVEETWAEERESQAVAAAAIPNSCLAVTIDTGDASNLHPPEKGPWATGWRDARWRTITA